MGACAPRDRVAYFRAEACPCDDACCSVLLLRPTTVASEDSADDYRDDDFRGDGDAVDGDSYRPPWKSVAFLPFLRDPYQLGSYRRRLNYCFPVLQLLQYLRLDSFAAAVAEVLLRVPLGRHHVHFPPNLDHYLRAHHHHHHC